MKYYRMWAIAFFLKAAGSAWDASYHFKYFFEEYSLPHITNFIGFLLGLVLLGMEFKKPRYMDRQSKVIVFCAYLLFLIAIPLDFSYHLTYGIDLTTWSPTHFLYYLATAGMIFGVWRGFRLYLGREMAGFGAVDCFLAFFMVEDLLFPCMQQENGAVALYQYVHHESIASKDLLALIQNPVSQIYGGVPEWVYPIYAVLVVSALCWAVFRVYGDMRPVIYGACLYLVFRYAARGIFAWVQYPQSFVPFVIVLIPLLLHLLRNRPYLAALVASTVYFGVLFTVSKTHLLVAPPVEAWMIFPVWLAALLAYVLVNNWQVSAFQAGNRSMKG